VIIFAVTDQPSSDPEEAAAGHLETVSDAFPDEEHVYHLISGRAGLQGLRDQLMAFEMTYWDALQTRLPGYGCFLPPISVFGHSNSAPYHIDRQACQAMIANADRADQDRKQLSTMQPYEWAKFMRLLRTAARYNGLQIFETTAQVTKPSGNKRSKQHDNAAE
jgi:hypothetical protein